MKYKFEPTKVMALVSKLKPTETITLVKDQGIYLMSFAQEVGKRDIVYAENCDPSSDEDWYEGGDDFGDDVGTAAEWTKILKQARGMITLELTETDIRILA